MGRFGPLNPSLNWGEMFRGSGGPEDSASHELDMGSRKSGFFFSCVIYIYRILYFILFKYIYILFVYSYYILYYIFYFILFFFFSLSLSPYHRSPFSHRKTRVPPQVFPMGFRRLKPPTKVVREVVREVVRRWQAPLVEDCGGARDQAGERASD